MQRFLRAATLIGLALAVLVFGFRWKESHAEHPGRFSDPAVLKMASEPLAPALNEPTVKVKETYYKVFGRTGRDLKTEMRRKGPKGFWAYTRWHVRWSSDCRIVLEINYTFPELADRAKVPLTLRLEWDKMMERLVAHERGHGEHGRTAVQEMARAHCENAKAIIDKWAAEDKKYDNDTHHGASQGVVLPN